MKNLILLIVLLLFCNPTWKTTAVEYTNTNVTKTDTKINKNIIQPKKINFKHKITFYTIKKGDCLSSICKKITGNGTKKIYKYYAKLNRIQNPDKIYPGKKLIFKVCKKIIK